MVYLKKIIFIALAFLFFASLGNFINAADEIEDEIRLVMGEAKTISVSNPTRVVIGKPNIADVTEVTKNQMTITPKTEGNTILVLWDSFGEHSYRIRVFSEDPAQVKRRVDSLLKKLDLPEVYSQIDDVEGKVFLMGRVRNSQDRERMGVVLGELKNLVVDLVLVKEEESVVEIDVQVFEIDRDYTKELGMTWPSNINLTEASGPVTVPVSGSKLFHISDWTRNAFSPIKLDLLIREGKARILSRPRLACQSGKKAEMLIGGEKPVFTTSVASAGGQGADVTYKEYGIKLEISPTVVNSNRIKLSLIVEVSDVGTQDSIGSATTTTAKAYPLTKRTASTELFLNNSQTMAIGGLIRRKSEESSRKVPWLGNIPVLGMLFRQKTTNLGGGQGNLGDQELFITLTPRIVSEDQLVIFKPEEKKQPGGNAIFTLEESVTQPKDEDKEQVGGPSPFLAADFRDPITAYAHDLQKRILLDSTYPSEAREAGFQGTVRLSLHLSFDGELKGVTVKESSGYQILDDWAVSLAKGITSFPAFPPAIKQKELWVDVPIDFKLD